MKNSAYVPPRQLATLTEEQQAKIDEIFETMPKTYEQDGLGDEAVAHLHYMVETPNGHTCHWFITEKDMEEPQYQAFGLVLLHNLPSELGYISLVEVCEIDNMRLDLDFKPTTLSQIYATYLQAA